ncbi:MAG: hypothetical protein FWC45_03485 [Treponema sp.]|nr:hypothetical protein [Treponema sp.]
MGKKPITGKRSGSLKWHPAFFQAIQAELEDYRDTLEYHYEFPLTTEPLRMDLLIIKKQKDAIIGKNIARIFRSDNILEFKSPGDFLSIQDFLKVYSYATLYAAITPGVDLSDTTITFVTNRYPRKLIGYLTKERHYTVKEKQSGIYTVAGDYIPIQVIESKKLTAAENLWLRSLTDDLEIEIARVILGGRKVRRKTRLDAYFDVILRANPKTFLEVTEMARRKTFEEVFTEAGIIPQWIEQGVEKGIKQGIKKGEAKAKLEIARSLLAKGWTFDEIAEVTKIPSEKVRLMTVKGA